MDNKVGQWRANTNFSANTVFQAFSDKRFLFADNKVGKWIIKLGNEK